MSRILAAFVASATIALVGMCPAWASDTYEIDPDHTSVTFKISHLGIGWVHGRFNEVAGTATVNANDPTKSSFTLTIPVKSIDTKVEQRDEHLRSADFFDVEKYSEMTFKSTKVKRIGKGLEVTGDLTLHGVTKLVTFELIGGQTAEFPEGVQRIGYSTSFVLKRSDFGMKTMLGPVGDEVHTEISFQAIKK